MMEKMTIRHKRKNNLYNCETIHGYRASVLRTVPVCPGLSLEIIVI